MIKTYLMIHLVLFITVFLFSKLKLEYVWTQYIQFFLVHMYSSIGLSLSYQCLGFGIFKEIIKLILVGKDFSFQFYAWTL
jgi:hypothetical protein